MTSIVICFLHKTLCIILPMVKPSLTMMPQIPSKLCNIHFLNINSMNKEQVVYARFWIGSMLLWFVTDRWPISRGGGMRDTFWQCWIELCYANRPKYDVMHSNGGLETWFYGSRSRLSMVSVSSRSRGSKVSVSLETDLSRPQDLKKKKWK